MRPKRAEISPNGDQITCDLKILSFSQLSQQDQTKFHKVTQFQTNSTYLKFSFNGVGGFEENPRGLLPHHVPLHLPVAADLEEERGVRLAMAELRDRESGGRGGEALHVALGIAEECRLVEPLGRRYSAVEL